jgi:Dehydrogenases with different specificities (related to short-chain alcohol dehydrogenases)
MALLKDKVALITGGSSGIGKAIALLFAKEGAKIVIADLKQNEGEEVVKEINQNFGEAIFVKTDVSINDEVKNLISKTISNFNKLNILVNSAGIRGILADTVNYPEEEFDRVIKVNLKGTWLCMKYAIPEMIKSGGGSIINISSVSGIVATPNSCAYTASKGGVIQLTKSAALEYIKHNIRVNCIAPSATKTPMLENLFKINPEFEKHIFKEQIIGRLAEPEEIANLALFLASDLSSFITGAVIVADGGYTIH